MSNRWSPFVKQLIVVILLFGTVWLLAQIHVIIPPVIIALLLAYIVSVPVGWILHRTGWRRAPVVLITQIVVVLLLLTIPALITPWAVNAFGAFGNTLVKVGQELLQVEPKPISITSSLTIDLGPFYKPINEWLLSLLGPNATTLQSVQRLLGPLAGGAAVVVRGAVSGVVWMIFVLVFSFYMVKDGPRLGRFVAVNVPEPWRPEVGQLWHEIVRIWNSFASGQFGVAFIMGVHRHGDHGSSGRAKRGGARPDIGGHGVCPRHWAGDRGGARHFDRGLSGFVLAADTEPVVCPGGGR